MAALACFVGVSCCLAETHDLVIYGSSPAGLAAAVQAKRMGLKAVVVSPETRIGGLTTGGLGQTDIGNKQAFGGIALEFYRDVAKHYRDSKAWTREKMSDYSPDGQCFGSKGADSMWTFEPSAALKILEGWEKRDGLDIRRGKRLDRSKGKVEVEGLGLQRKIISFKTEDGTEFRGKMFVDATYEGDLLAAAGVSYTVGREGNSVYGETLNGIQRSQGYHKFEPKVSAYVVPGDPTSGLLPNVVPDTSDPDGTGDKRVQAYCFRMCLTDDPANRIPFAKPENYNPLDYELLVRNLVEQEKNHPEWKGSSNTWHGFPWINSRMPNRKTDTNNCRGFSTDFIGRNWAWPEASYAERTKILKEHLNYQQGLMWTLANDPRIPDRLRNEIARWGTCKDEFPDGLGDGWQDQLYVREGRRMVGDYVMIEQNCRGQRTAPHPVAMGAYSMDSHHVRRYVDEDGYVQNEGDVEVHKRLDGTPFEPYGIEYAAIVPKRVECGNLFVPVCLSASHIAFGSIRMEPVFFALGQAAGTAAAQAIADGVVVQDVDYGKLSARLAADGQVLSLSSGMPGRDPQGPAKHGILCLTFDDRHWDSWVGNLPLFRKYGARCSFFPNGPLDDKALQKLKILKDDGHAVGPHTLAHADAPAFFKEKGGEAYWLEQIKPQMDALARVGIRPACMAYPNNRHSPETDAFLKTKGIRRFRCGVPTCWAPNKNGRTHAEVEEAYSQAEGFGTLTVAGGFGVGEFYKTDIDDLLKGLERAADRNETLVLYSHDISPDAKGVSMKTPWLEKILFRAAELGMAFRTLED